MRTEMTHAIAHSEKDWSHNPAVIAFAWGAVGIPLLWGVLNTLIKAFALFH
ncbi:MAG TPA: hypothetical protein VFF12_03510 [Myxococcaceae bacterium]|nr:hypothetical protein [Myxococcaceae bacterium]